MARPSSLLNDSQDDLADVRRMVDALNERYEKGQSYSPRVVVKHWG